ncbi:MAG: carboxynorspermidine decarboxylase [Nanoarchaeota archaeon]|nr:carboxynorspermidine decarboxylase [Nanoarchaeota archaeon]MBU1005461.1 carboxynorspermidine decarboxylase [Nanoarchaeota archaeon]MBU1947031.1 carboxynorspermidine decarboxylase [Nanoarchaeota archaeon]
MDSKGFQRDIARVDTPCFIIDEGAIEKNLKILDSVQKEAGCKILLALKAYAAYCTFPLISKYLCGVCASGLNEAKLGKEEFGKEVHTFAPGFSDSEFDEVVKNSTHIVFNSFSQLEKFKSSVKGRKIGLRVNPEKSVAGVKFGVYDPCTKNSRLGIKAQEFSGKSLEGVSGLHFHCLCEQGVEPLEEVLKVFMDKFDPYIKKMSWVNFGGGHHITKADYDVGKLIKIIVDFKKRYPNIQEVYLEPGEAVVLNSGYMAASVLDIIHSGKDIAILDTSVESHILDVLITRNEPGAYVPEIMGAGVAGKFKFNYVLGGVSCAAGDVIGEYSFPKQLKVGDKLVFLDMAYYTIVKTNTFNGVNLPSIFLLDNSGKLKLVKKFRYSDFKGRL